MPPITPIRMIGMGTSKPPLSINGLRMLSLSPGEPVRAIHNTASANMRWSRPHEPRVRSSPMMWANPLPLVVPRKQAV